MTLYVKYFQNCQASFGRSECKWVKSQSYKKVLFSLITQVMERLPYYVWQGLSRLCVQRVIWTPRTLFFDSLDTQKFMSEFGDDDFS